MSGVEQRRTSRGSHEWYTPPSITEKARTVMGGIDLDPASCKMANTIVRADRYIDKEEDGLAMWTEWRKVGKPPVRVWRGICPPSWIQPYRHGLHAGVGGDTGRRPLQCR